jgi:hypothetical protein
MLLKNQKEAYHAREVQRKQQARSGKANGEGYDSNGGKRERRTTTRTTRLLLCRVQDVVVGVDFLFWLQLFLPCAWGATQTTSKKQKG